ncbi:hypothetical protein ACF05W_21500 [Streptomyces lydicus]|uniref:hypothetical protein n=1 Tax=Streptomyces lydicus TaxID=47763 RepID=UPI003701EA8F
MPLATATLRRTRRLAAASLLAAAALSLTACQSGGDPAPAASSSSAGDPAPADGGAKGGPAASSAGGSASGGSSGGSSAGGEQAGGGSGSAPGKGASRTGAGQTSATGGSGAQGGASAGNKGVGGTWVGTLKWLTEDKLTVAPKGGMEQAFYVTDSTKVLGAAALCEAPDGRVHTDGSGYGTTSCTLADLRKAARLGAVEVRVTVANGEATKVAEHYHP